METCRALDLQLGLPGVEKERERKEEEEEEEVRLDRAESDSEGGFGPQKGLV